MSYDIYAYLVVGVRVSPTILKSKLHRTEKRRGCGCTSEAPTSKFCPDCGQEVWKDVQVTIAGYDGGCEFHNFELIATCPERPPEFIAYKMWCVHAVPVIIPKLDLESIKTEMQLKLEPVGLWDACAFGLHLFRYESF